MIDLEQQLADHLKRKAAVVTPRYDLEAVEHGIGSVVAIDSRGSGRRAWFASAAAALVVVTGSVVVIVNRDGENDSISTAETDVTTSPPVASPPTVPEVVPTVPSTVGDVVPTIPSTAAAFLGNWVSIDVDRLFQRLEIVDSGQGAYDIAITDDVAWACASTSATIVGAGRLESDVRLVVAQPAMTCDDGSTPSIGPPPQGRLANYALQFDPSGNRLVDSGGVVWQRPGEASTPKPTPLGSGGMWPQTTVDEVRAAQQGADAGDSDYTWQIGTQLTTADMWANTGDLEISARFLREVLGWESFVSLYHEVGPNGWFDGVLEGLEYLRCAPGRTNPFYPPSPEGGPGTSCAPTIDDLQYESVRLDLAQLDRQGQDGVWVVTEWELTTFAQSDPTAVIALAREHLEQQLAARVAGRGAEEQAFSGEIQLLYATSSGSPYERYEVELTSVGEWPDGEEPIFKVRLLADGGATVVEQEAQWKGLWAPMDVGLTTENGVPVSRLRSSDGGGITVSAADPWGHGTVTDRGLWVFLLARNLENYELITVEFSDPVAYDSWCESIGGAPLLSTPADAATIAERVIADPNLDTTAPVTVRVGGVEAISIDVELAPGGKVPCGMGSFERIEPGEAVGRWIHELSVPGRRLRIYLLDMPQGMRITTMAITIAAPQDRFDEVIEMTKPIIDSIKFNPN